MRQLLTKKTNKRHIQKIFTTLITTILIISSLSALFFIGSVAKAVENPNSEPNEDIELLENRDDIRRIKHIDIDDAIDDTPPTIRSSPTSRDWSSDPIRVEVMLYDRESGLRSYSYGWGETSDPSSVGQMSFPTPITGRTYRFIAIKENPDGEWYLHVWVSDEDGNEQESCSGPYQVDKTNPNIYISINNDNEFTNNRSVTLDIEYQDEHSGISAVRYSNDRRHWTQWESPQANKEWTLIDRDGEKTVYIQAMDNAQNIAENSDSIILDRRGPEGSILINNGDEYTNSTDVELFLEYDDSLSGVKEVRYSNDRGEWSEWFEPTDFKEWILNLGDGEKVVHYQMKDFAENYNEASDTIIVDKTSPTISVSPESQTLDENNANPQIHVSINIDDSYSGVDVYRYSWSENSTHLTSSWESWESYIHPINLKKNDHGKYYLHMQTKDKIGNEKYEIFGPYQINSAPSGDINISTDETDVSTTITLSADVSDDTDIIDYEWDLNNDGETDFNGQSIDYTFNLSYNYSIKLTATDEDGAKTTITKYLNVKETNVLTTGLNYYVWKKNTSLLASELADIIGLETYDIIIVYNYSISKWNEQYVVNWSGSDKDFLIKKNDVLKIKLNGNNRYESFTIVGNSLNVYNNKNLRYINDNDGYNWVGWTEEKRIRASSIAQSIELEHFQTISVYNKSSGSYKTYVKLPNDDNVGVDALDPWIYPGDSFLVKIKNNYDKEYLTTEIDIGYTIGVDEPE
jgi:hypothetical protein